MVASPNPHSALWRWEVEKALLGITSGGGGGGSTAWVDITGKPSTFPPDAHAHPISDVTNLQTTLNNKEPLIVGGTTAQYWRGDKTWAAHDKASVGLGSVDNTADASKPVSTATQTALNLKEDKANKGVANGYAPLDASTKIAATYLPAYVDDVLEFANLAGFPVTGVTGIIYVALDTNKVYRWSGSAYVEISPSPGSTDAVPEGSTNLYYTTARATSAAIAAIPPATVAPLMDGVAAVGTVAKYAKEDHKHPSDTAKLDASAYTAADVLTKIKTVDGAASGLDADLLDAQDGAYYLAWGNLTGKPATFPPALPIAQSDVTNLVSDLALKAPLASPAFTGNPTAPTPSVGDTDTSIATTAFVMAAVAAGGGGGGTVAIADGPPASPSAGTMWFESDTGHTFIWYVDPSGPPGQWLQINAGAMGPQGVVGPQGIQGDVGPTGPQGLIADAPSDGGEYVRVNGVWRLKQQSFDLAGKTTQDVTVPAWGPSMARFTFFAYLPATVVNMHMRISVDGTTFASAASDYNYGGGIQYSGSSGNVTSTGGAASGWPLTATGDNATVPEQATTEVVLVRTPPQIFTYRSNSYSFYSPATNIHSLARLAGYAVNTNLPGTGPIKALRLYNGTGATMTSGKLNVEWLP